MAHTEAQKALISKALAHTQNPRLAQILALRLMMHARWRDLESAVQFLDELEGGGHVNYLQAYRPEDPEAIQAMLMMLRTSNVQ
jgi:hypothetical protein